jgi:peptide/nickel transport system ATP-binding protein
VSQPIVETVGLSKDFALPGLAPARLFGRRPRVFHAVDSVSFEVREGETLGLVGESGSGKSTLSRLLVRLMSVTSGRILFGGQDITHWTDRQLRPLRLHFTMGKQERLRRIHELLTQVGLTPEHADALPHQLSGGMRQRVAIARAIAARPRFIVCDEPVSALDVSIQAQVLALLRHLQETFRLTYLFISHDLGVVSQLADRIAVMQHGRLVEVGPAEEVMRRPRHAYTQELIASAPRLP